MVTRLLLSLLLASPALATDAGVCARMALRVLNRHGVMDEATRALSVEDDDGK